MRLGTASVNINTTDSTGLHFDDFRISSTTTLADDNQAANNNGAYTPTTNLLNMGPQLNEPGALVGDTDRAAQLDGANDYVTVPDSASLDLGDGPLTLEAWVKRNVTTGTGSFFYKGTGAFKFGFNVDKTYVTNVTATLATSTATVTGTAWHHLVVTKAPGETKLYIDGVDRTGTVTDQVLADTTTALAIGKGASAEWLNATIDEFAVYNAALPAPTVLDHYKAGIGAG
jgi:hypothetical protein